MLLTDQTLLPDCLHFFILFVPQFLTFINLETNHSLLSDSMGNQTHSHLVREQTLNHLDELACFK